jgi:hypothetical protein
VQLTCRPHVALPLISVWRRDAGRVDRPSLNPTKLQYFPSPEQQVVTSLPDVEGLVVVNSEAA